MGYDLHITRADDDWSRKDKPEIALREWQDCLAAQADFDVTGVAETTNPETGEVIRVEQPGIAAWRGHSSGETVWFSLWRGNVVVKNPDPETVGEMCSMAAALNARVQGDDGEWYDQPVARKPWWKRW